MVAFLRQARQRSLRGNANDALYEWTGARAGEDGIGERRSERAAAGKAIGKTKDIVLKRMKAALVVLREEFRFIGSHIHLNRALGFAGLATQAEVESVVDGAALETLLAQGSGEHPQRR